LQIRRVAVGCLRSLVFFAALQALCKKKDRATGSALGQFPRDAGEKGLGMDWVHRREEDVGKN